MGGKVIMPEKLTAENGGKALMMGEFFETVKQPCQYELCEPDDCPGCEGKGFSTMKVIVSWTTIKDIYSKAVGHFGEEVR